MTTHQTEPMAIVREFAAPQEKVWAAWTDPKAIAQWMGPKGSTTELLEYDLRPGGLWRARMQHPAGIVLHTRFTFREVLPFSRLVYEHSFADEAGTIVTAPFFDHWPHVILATVLFEEDAGKTKVTLLWEPLGATAEEVAMFDAQKPGMTAGWGGSFDQLEAYLASA